MTAARRISALVLAASLVTGVSVAPAWADQSARISYPEITSMQKSGEPAPVELAAAVSVARAEFTRAITTARAERRAARVLPRAERDAARAAASTKAQRRSATRTYRRAVAPITAQYVLARKVARTTRDAAIEEALATYLAAIGRAELAQDLSTYRDATAKARDTLALALRITASTIRTDTADERMVLLAEREQATTRAERSAAWKQFVATTRTERAAQASAIASARSTYFSAMSQARAGFRARTGTSIPRLLELAFER